MKSGWVDRDAEAIVAEGAKSGIDRDLALRIYTTRLLGRDPKLVLHGGGNTSLKELMRDRLGADVEVLRVKATGADMAMIDLAGLPAVRLSPLRKLRALGEIGDDELVGIERASLIDPAAANPSVEILLHAFLPHKFVDHTHATAVLSVIDQPDGEKNARKFSAAGSPSCLTSCRVSAWPRRRSMFSSGRNRVTASSSRNTASSPMAKAHAKPMSA